MITLNYVHDHSLDGFVTIESPDGEALEKSFVHAGVRERVFADPLHRDRRLVEFRGGYDDDDRDFEVDGVVASLSARELRQLAASLDRAAETLSPPDWTAPAWVQRIILASGLFLLTGVACHLVHS